MYNARYCSAAPRPWLTYMFVWQIIQYRDFLINQVDLKSRSLSICLALTQGSKRCVYGYARRRSRP